MAKTKLAKQTTPIRAVISARLGSWACRKPGVWNQLMVVAIILVVVHSEASRL